MNFVFIDLTEDLIAKAFEIDAEDTVYLFPNQASVKLAKQRFFANFAFSNTKFLSLSEFENEVLFGGKIKLKEEKRTFAFYKALSAENKKHLGITNYFDSIKTSQNFFALFDELNQEMIDFESVIELLQDQSHLNQNQLAYFYVLLAVRADYKIFCQQNNYFDSIFAKLPDKVEYQNFKNFVVVNQFWFTKQEQYIFKNLPNTTIIWQLPQALQCPDNNFRLINEIKPEHLPSNTCLHVNTFTNKQQMLAGFLSVFENFDFDVVIDFPDTDSNYYLSANYFSKKHESSFSKTSIYIASELIYNIVLELVYTENQTLYNLQTVLDFLAFEKNSQFFKNVSKLKDFLYKLADRGYLYLNYFVKINDEIVKTDYDALLEILAKVSKLKHLDDIVDFFTEYNYFDEDLLKHCKLKTEFETICHDFKLLQNLDVYCIKPTVINSLRLWLEYLKPKVLSYEVESQNVKTRLAGIQNTRNQNFDKIAILNFVQGKLPTLPKNAGFLTEGQRQKLGLKCYSDIKMRDKYYFYRLLANSKYAHAFTYYNLDTADEVSSYIEELIIAKKAKEFNIIKTAPTYLDIYKNHFKQSDFEFKTERISKKFFSFDFTESYLDLSFYKYIDLYYSPFEAYIKHYLQIKPKPVNLTYDCQATVTGNWVHMLFGNIFAQFVKNGDITEFTFDKVDENLFYLAFIQLKKSNSFLLTQPHNYAQNYFQLIYKPLLKQGILSFFTVLNNTFKQKPVKVFYEDEYSKISKSSIAFCSEHIPVYLKAKADLRIESDDIFYIFDYKTGKINSTKVNKYKKQLLFYLYSYYLLKNPVQKVDGMLWYCEEKKSEFLSKNFDAIDKKLHLEINKLSEILVNEGFCVLEKPLNEKICRSELKPDEKTN